MSDIALRVDGLGKRYRLGLEQGGRFRYKSLRDSVANAVKRPWSLVTDRRRMTDENSFWALHNVSFEVKQGEAIGIIGRNGAGKSTLLKILSQITKPTTGFVELYGRVGSLLEVGTGFHPELSGRENIFLNGAILGMRRNEIKKQFDEIVAFSEIERFLDTPVKQYSSGMYTRLAFAVAAHLNPEILVVDEVLAVGDAEFQKKCLGKMQDVAQGGRTILFVSHNMSAVTRLCTNSIMLQEGCVLHKGATHDVIEAYLTSGVDGATDVTFSSGPLKRASVRALDRGFRLVAEYECTEPVDLPALGFVLSTSTGGAVLGDNPRLSRLQRLPRSQRSGTVIAEVTSPPLRDGEYVISLWFGDSCSNNGAYPDALRFTAAGQETGGATNASIVGAVVPSTKWRFE